MSAMIPDPEADDRWLIGNASSSILGAAMGPTTLVNVHPPEPCAGEACVVHNPSDHSMRDWPLNFRGDRGFMERICLHGVGHPDPDSLAWHERNGRDYYGQHACDGCCNPDAGGRA